MGDACDIKLNNQVYNVLKKHSQTEQKRHQRVKDKEEKATAEMSMDANTRLILFKMVNNGLLESVGGAIATGKESVVFHALGGEIQENGKVVPTECAIKVFKTVLSEFKNRSEYVKDDFRFKNPRKVLRVWAEKEFLNLNRMNRVGIRCPQVVKLKKHVLVLSFIGQDGHPAPKLKDVVFNDQESKLAAFNDCQELMVRLYRECRLVHADLSEFNLLYWDSKCWMIDVSQAVDLSHPKSLVFLARDCQNIVDYFACAGLDEVPTVRELFNRITDMNIESSDDDFLLQVQQFALQNRPVQFKADKAKPAAAELRKYYEYKGEQNSRDASPARDYH
uniref:Serine/threonine-protein kinase RIO3 n=1 Tax=Plectus sambesii TaxID=2011161 RepID=A0A914UVP1_9BILA